MKILRVILVLLLFVLVTTTFAFSEALKIRVTASAANIRLKPTVQSAILLTAPLGAVLDVIRQEESWYFVQLPPNKDGIVVTGFIHQGVVEVIEATNEIKKVEEVKPVVKEIKPPKVEPAYLIKKTPTPQRKIAFKIGGGINALLGDWSEYYDIGFSVNGSVIYPVSPGIDLIGGAEFSRSTGKSTEYKYEDYEWKADFSFSRIIFFGDARYNFKGETNFFVEGGLGIYSDKEEIELERETWGEKTETLSISDSGTNLGIRIGGGAVFSNIEIMGIFHMVENSNMFTFVASFRF